MSAAAAAPPPAANPARAALWMTGSIASFSLMAIAGRELSDTHSSFEIMLWRSLFGLLIVLPAIALSRGGAGQLRTRRPGLHALRNLGHFWGQNCWFYAIGVIPLAQVFAFEFTAPIWVILLAPLFLGEPFTRWRAIAVALAFLGVLLVTRPFAAAASDAGADIAFGQAIAAAAAIGFAISVMTTKKLSATETTLCILFYMTASQAAMAFAIEATLRGGLPPWPDLREGLWLAVVGACGLAAHFSLTTALRHADATVVAPMDFVRLPAIAVVGAALYNEAVDLAVVLGGALVFLGNFLNLRAEARRRAS